MTDTKAAPAGNPRQQKSRELKDIDFSNLRRELSSIKSASGESLFAHLQKVFEQLMLHSPDLALERFEEVSYMFKHNIDLKEFLKLEEVRNYSALAASSEAYCEQMKPHFAQPEPDEDGVIPAAEPLATQVQDLLSASRIFQWAGISFGEQETYRLQKSIKKLAAAKPHKAIRFFGKIYGTEKDYYVVEAQGEVADDEDAPADGGDEEGEPDPRLEAKGTGVNELTYYVA